MSTITCNSCGMQYDGSGLQPGVQFQCTQCGAMVAVGAAPPPAAARGPARPRGGPPGRGPAKGPARAPAGRGPARGPRPAAGGPPGPGDQQSAGYGPPRKSSNAGVFVGIGVGVVVLALIVIAVVASGGPSPEDVAKQQREEANKKRAEAVKKQDEEQRKANELITKPMEAAMAQAGDVFAALKNQDAATLDAMFDWQTFAAYNQTLVDSNADYLNSPLMAVGTWEKDGSGKYTGKFLGEVAHGPDSLKDRIMGYLKEFVFGAEGLEWEKAKTEADAGSFTLPLNGKKYLGKRVFFTYKGAGKTKELWLGALEGSDQVRIINYVDGSSAKNLQTKEAKNERVVDDRDPYNPDRDPTRNPDNPDNPEDPPLDPDASLPEVAKTGSMPTAAALVNAVEELKRGGDLNTARVNSIKGESSKQEKKATMGAFIDLLIDAVKSNDRTMKLRISSALWDVWSPFVPQDWGKADMVYTQGFDGQSESDLHVRRWLEIYNTYPLD